MTIERDGRAIALSNIEVILEGKTVILRDTVQDTYEDVREYPSSVDARQAFADFFGGKSTPR